MTSRRFLMLHDVFLNINMFQTFCVCQTQSVSKQLPAVFCSLGSYSMFNILVPICVHALHTMTADFMAQIAKKHEMTAIVIEIVLVVGVTVPLTEVILMFRR